MWLLHVQAVRVLNKIRISQAVKELTLFYGYHVKRTYQPYENPFHTLPSHILLIFCPSLHIGIQNHLSLTGFLEENFLWLRSFECSIYPTHLILTMFCEDWKLWSSPFWNFCRLFLLSSSLSLNYFSLTTSNNLLPASWEQ